MNALSSDMIEIARSDLKTGYQASTWMVDALCDMALAQSGRVQGEPVAWKCDFMDPRDVEYSQIVMENPAGLRFNDIGEPSPFRVTPLYAAAPTGQEQALLREALEMIIQPESERKHGEAIRLCQRINHYLTPASGQEQNAAQEVGVSIPPEKGGPPVATPPSQSPSAAPGMAGDKVKDVRRALNALRLEVDGSIVNDISGRIEAAFVALRSQEAGVVVPVEWVEALVRYNGNARSFFQISNRIATDLGTHALGTNFGAFAERTKELLDETHQLTNEARAMLSSLPTSGAVKP